jgi:DNA-binding CsgD family transcriptional regulator
MPIIGRENDLATLDAMLDNVRRGPSQYAILEGEAGIGKTRLIEEITQHAREAGFTCVHGSGKDHQRERPFGVLADALEVDAASTETDGRTNADLLRDWGPDPSATTSDHRFRICQAIEDAFERKAMERPVLLVVEDVHWADASSILALHFLSDRDDLALFLVLTCRPVPRSEELTRLMHGIIESGGQHFRLQPLVGASVGELAAARLGADPGPRLLGQLARGGGNPLFILELLDGLAEEHMIEVRNGSAETPHSVQPPPSLRTLVIRRLGFLDRDSLELLRVASVLGQPFSAHELSVVTGEVLGDILKRLETPVTAGFVSAEGEAFAFRHDVVREALYEDIAPAVRKGLHLHAAHALNEAGTPPVGIAHHVALGAEPGDREAIGWLYNAAIAVAPRAPETASDLFSHAARLLPVEDPDRIALLMPAIRHLTTAGRVAEARALADRLAPEVEGTPMQMMLDLERVNLLMLDTRTEEVEAFVQGRLEAGGLPDTYRMLMLTLSATMRAAAGDIRTSNARIAEVRPFVAAFPESAAAALCCFVDGAIAWMQGRFGESVEQFEHALPGTNLFVGGPDQGMLTLGTALALSDRHAEALVTFEQARAGLERRGMVQYLVEHHWFLGHALFVSGRWDDALAEIAASRQLASETGAMGNANAIPDPTPLIHTFRGDDVAAAEALARFDREPTTGPAFLANWCDPMRAIVHAGAGGAIGVLRSWHRTMKEMSFVPDFRTVGRSIVRICRAADERTLLEQLLEDAIETFKRASGIRSAEGASLLVQGAITGNVDQLVAAVGASRLGGRPFDIAEASAECAIALLREGKEKDGRALATEAFDRYAELGARGSEAALAQDVRRFGMRRSSGQRRAVGSQGWESLTASELRVVALVAEGLTNGEISARLYVSRGTVATHLRSVFRKLGVSSRSALAAEAARRPS